MQTGEAQAKNGTFSEKIPGKKGVFIGILPRKHDHMNKRSFQRAAGGKSGNIYVGITGYGSLSGAVLPNGFAAGLPAALAVAGAQNRLTGRPGGSRKSVPDKAMGYTETAWEGDKRNLPGAAMRGQRGRFQIPPRELPLGRKGRRERRRTLHIRRASRGSHLAGEKRYKQDGFCWNPQKTGRLLAVISPAAGIAGLDGAGKTVYTTET